MRFRLASMLASCTALLLAVVVLAVAGIALAARPQAGYRFATSSTSTAGVFFTAASGKRLTGFSANLALKCALKVCGGFGGIKTFGRNSVKVSKHGTFTVRGRILTEADQKIGTETVTGRFVSPTKVKGKVTTHIHLADYRGITLRYTATGTPATG